MTMSCLYVGEYVIDDNMYTMYFDDILVQESYKQYLIKPRALHPS